MTGQPARLLAYLQAHGSITRLEAMQQLGIMNLWSRIADLEKLDYLIDHQDGVEVQDRYGNKCRVTKYVLVSEPESLARPSLSMEAA